MDETIFLQPLEETVAFGQTPAERMLQKYENAWGKDITKVFDEYAF